MNNYADYYNLPNFVKNQITTISDIYKNNNNVQSFYNSILADANLTKNTSHQDLLNYSVLKKITTKHILEYNYDKLECYSDDNKKITLTKLIKPDKRGHPSRTSKHAVVLGGMLNDKEVVVKYYEADDEKIDISFEIGIYNKLLNMGCKVPWFNDQFMVLNKRVLVIEKLDKLDKNDDIYKIGMSVISQLSYLHTFAIHNDIKPDNIMKKTVDGKTHYYLIDYGGVATSKLCCGYKRRIWSPRWTCQERGAHNQVTNPKHDFIELAYTLNYIHKGCSYNGYKDICKTHLGKFDSFVKTLGKHHTKNINYEEVVDIFRSYSKN
ncbi:protein kinase [Fadolivirus algeromassiliense]|jgi:serine/threonine protein kinase|uniref:Protein kinase n=1 Tax=Fadolivirus FV1/VV64 TaxID=3070911 RepID=A0A7D3QW19_9VIRU|nr:protein kinase [Fadolivirus algeromassiliense]QKF94159.1 protein kinase [Fadolivirus FV1/VV64]